MQALHYYLPTDHITHPVETTLRYIPSFKTTEPVLKKKSHLYFPLRGGHGPNRTIASALNNRSIVPTLIPPDTLVEAYSMAFYDPLADLYHAMNGTEQISDPLLLGDDEPHATHTIVLLLHRSSPPLRIIAPEVRIL